MTSLNYWQEVSDLHDAAEWFRASLSDLVGFATGRKRQWGLNNDQDH